MLAYTDSWEEGSRLFIRTELCELGNFARFLWEYGRVYPRLDEARVWKIIADLSNVGRSSRIFSRTIVADVKLMVTRRVFGLSTKQE